METQYSVSKSDKVMMHIGDTENLKFICMDVTESHVS